MNAQKNLNLMRRKRGTNTHITKCSNFITMQFIVIHIEEDDFNFEM